jgi:hypothetical protein
MSFTVAQANVSNQGHAVNKRKTSQTAIHSELHIDSLASDRDTIVPVEWGGPLLNSCKATTGSFSLKGITDKLVLPAVSHQTKQHISEHAQKYFFSQTPTWAFITKTCGGPPVTCPPTSRALESLCRAQYTYFAWGKPSMNSPKAT